MVALILADWHHMRIREPLGRFPNPTHQQSRWIGANVDADVRARNRLGYGVTGNPR
jgi:hypothetical protein